MSNFTLKRGAFGPSIEGKLHTMRKPDSWFVQPRSDGLIHLSGNRTTGVFDPATGKGRFNIKGSYFAHLHYAMGAVDYTFPEDFVTLAKECMLAPGEETSFGGMTLVNTIEVI